MKGRPPPLTLSQLERAWAVNREGWLTRAANTRTLKDAYGLLDQLQPYAEAAGFPMVPVIQEGFRVGESDAMKLLATWRFDRQKKRRPPRKRGMQGPRPRHSN